MFFYLPCGHGLGEGEGPYAVGGDDAKKTGNGVNELIGRDVLETGKSSQVTPDLFERDEDDLVAFFHFLFCFVLIFIVSDLMFVFG